MATDEPIVFEMPADADHLVTARVFAAAVGRQTGVPEDHIIGLQLAVSDIATWLIGAASLDGSIAIRATVADSLVGVEIQPVGFPMPAEETISSGEIPEPTGDAVWGLELVRALVEDLTVNSSESKVSFWLPRGARSPGE